MCISLFQLFIFEMSERIVYQDRDSAFRRRLLTFAVVNLDHIDIREFLEDAYSLIHPQLSELLEIHTLVKVNTIFEAVFSKLVVTDEGEKIEQQTIYITTYSYIIDFETDLGEYYKDKVVSTILENVENIAMRGSGFTLSNIVEIRVQVNEFQPITGATYIDLPAILVRKHAIVNVRNTDNQCFKYAILSALYPVSRNANRVSNYKPYSKVLKFDGIGFPVKIKDIGKFERLNDNISVNVYMYDEKNGGNVLTLRMTRAVKANHIHLMLLTHNEKSHYCWIKDMSRLLSSQISNNANRVYFCDRCLNHFGSIDLVAAHKVYCLKQNEHAVVMPTEQNCTVRFKNYNHKLKVPFIVYADIETLLKAPDSNFSKSNNTVAYQEHEAFSIAYYFKCMHNTGQSYFKSYRGEECVEWFTKELHDIAYKVSSILNNVKEMDTTIEDKVFFAFSDECHICGERYSENDIPVRDHCHLTGKYRGSAHSNCNLNFQVSRHIPVVFHNLSHYDSHFLMRKLATVFPGEISIIPIKIKITFHSLRRLLMLESKISQSRLNFDLSILSDSCHRHWINWPN